MDDFVQKQEKHKEEQQEQEVFSYQERCLKSSTKFAFPCISIAPTNTKSRRTNDTNRKIKGFDGLVIQLLSSRLLHFLYLRIQYEQMQHKTNLGQRDYKVHDH